MEEQRDKWRGGSTQGNTGTCEGILSNHRTESDGNLASRPGSVVADGGEVRIEVGSEELEELRQVGAQVHHAYSGKIAEQRYRALPNFRACILMDINKMRVCVSSYVIGCEWHLTEESHRAVCSCG